MTTALTPDTAVDLWRDNRLDQQWSLTVEEIAHRYAALRPEPAGVPFMRDFAWFIGAAEGLSSVVGHDDDLPEFMAALAHAVFPIVVARRIAVRAEAQP